MNRNKRAGQRRKVRGAIAVMTALFLVVILAFAALSVDVGYLLVERVRLQNAADAGALAAAEALRNGPDTARAQGRHYANLNLPSDGTPVVLSEDVELGTWDEESLTFAPLGPDDEQRADAVRVTCRYTAARDRPVTLFFAKVLGHADADLAASSVARYKSSRCGLIIGLVKVTMSGSSHVDSYNSAERPYMPGTAGENGHVCSNGEIKLSGSSAIYGNAHPGPGKQVVSSSSIGVTGSTDPLAEVLSFPPADPGNAPYINDNGRIPNSVGGAKPLSGSEFKLSGGDHVDLPPGTYYFSKMTLSGGSTVGISGKTVIYVTGDCSLSGGSLANQTFLPMNLELYPLGSKCVISGGSELYAVIYGPTAKVERSSDSGFYGSIVSYELVLSGSGGIHADESISSENLDSGPSRAVLVE